MPDSDSESIEDLEPISLQAAGHPGTIFRSHHVGRLVKPATASEHAFYEATQADDGWRSVLPAYYGAHIDSHGSHLIHMEDLTHEMNEPCVMDLKMGVW